LNASQKVRTLNALWMLKNPSDWFRSADVSYLVRDSTSHEVSQFLKILHQNHFLEYGRATTDKHYGCWRVPRNVSKMDMDRFVHKDLFHGLKIPGLESVREKREK